MRFGFVLAVVAMMFFGCKNTPTCQKTMEVGASFIALQLECSNTAQIATDLGAKFCTQAPVQAAQGAVGDIMCPLFSEYLVSMANGQVPANWQCKKPLVTPDMKQKLIDECKKSITY
jgi:hypothetical protein